ncbi:MAG: hypothetical protein HKP03_05570 [Xanthomonadales bacterium]|nr:hypothetical protein [Xanthomonadales bacterium]
MDRNARVLGPFLLSAGLSLTLSLAAGNAVAEPSGIDRSEQAGSVPVFTVKPVRRMAALLPPAAQAPAAPVPANAAERGRILEALGVDAPAAGEYQDSAQDAESNRLLLSARQFSVPDRAHLSLVAPQTVHPDSPIVFSDAAAGSVAVRLNVEQGGAYLLDFAVTAKGAGNYRLKTEGGSRNVEDPAGRLGHVLLGLEAGASGWTTVRLDRAATSFSFHSVEITRVR